METVILKGETFNKIMNYLSLQPYNEVAELISITVKDLNELNAKPDKPTKTNE